MLIPFNRAIAIHVYTPVSGDGQAQFEDLPAIYFVMVNNLQFFQHIKLIALLD